MSSDKSLLSSNKGVTLGVFPIIYSLHSFSHHGLFLCWVIVKYDILLLFHLLLQDAESDDSDPSEYGKSVILNICAFCAILPFTRKVVFLQIKYGMLQYNIFKFLLRPDLEHTKGQFMSHKGIISVNNHQ